MELEDSLTLEELLELYEMASERQSRLAKVIAAAFGADVGDEPERSSYDRDKNNFTGSESLQDLPFNLGYEKIS